MTTITATQAYEAMLEHHKRLGEELAGRADAVSAAVAARRPYGAAVAGLVAYLAEEVLPHAAGEEQTIYPAAAAHADMAGMVGEMIAEHVTLSALGARVATLTDGTAAAGQAQQIAGLFTAHAAKENDVLLPALLADKSVDLAGLLAQMHDHAGHEAVSAPAAAGRKTPRPRWCPCCCRQRRRWPAPGRRTVPARSPRRRGPRCAMPGRTWRSR